MCIIKKHSKNVAKIINKRKSHINFIKKNSAKLYQRCQYKRSYLINNENNINTKWKSLTPMNCSIDDKEYVNRNIERLIKVSDKFAMNDISRNQGWSLFTNEKLKSLETNNEFNVLPVLKKYNNISKVICKTSMK